MFLFLRRMSWTLLQATLDNLTKQFPKSSNNYGGCQAPLEIKFGTTSSTQLFK